MRRTLLCLFMSCFLASQAGAQAGAQTLILSGPGTARAGATISLPLTLSGAGSPVALQWQIATPAGATATVAIGAAGTAASKTLSCTPDNTFCLEYGTNANVIAAGVVATYSLKLPSTIPNGPVNIALSNVIGGSNTGTSAGLTPGAAYSFSILDKRDLNGDGAVNVLDVTLMSNESIASVGNASACVDDQNGDGKCDLLDVLAVLLKALALVP